MALLLNLLFSVAFAGAIGGAVHLWRIHLDTARRDGMQALAARRGWALTVTDERLGRAGTLRLAPRGGVPWMAEARPGIGAGGPVTEYEAEEPAWSDGTLILVAAPEPRMEFGREPAKGVPGSLPPPSVRALRDLLGEQVARQSTQLRPVPAPEDMTALAEGEPSLRVDMAILSQAMQGFVPVAPGPKGRPVLILGPDGIRLRLRQTIKRPDQMERFLDLALLLSRLIGP
jgi:hypothetical protein